MKIRLEQPTDYREVESLTREAFWDVYCPGCKEHYVLNQYRNNPDFIPELDFVMEDEGKIIGHVMYSKAEIILEDGMVGIRIQLAAEPLLCVRCPGCRYCILQY